MNLFQMPIFLFELICDIIGDPEVNKIRVRSPTLVGLSDAVLILKIDLVVSEFRIVGAMKGLPLPSWTR